MAGDDDRHRVPAVRGANRAPGGRPPDGPRELGVGHGRPGGHAAKRHPYIALEGSAARLHQDVVHGAEVTREVGVDPTADAERIAGRLESRGAIARGEPGEHAATAMAKVEAHEALVPGRDDDAADRRGHLIREEVHGRALTASGGAAAAPPAHHHSSDTSSPSHCCTPGKMCTRSCRCMRRPRAAKPRGTSRNVPASPKAWRSSTDVVPGSAYTRLLPITCQVRSIAMTADLWRARFRGTARTS